MAHDPICRKAPLLTGADIVYAPSCVDYHPEHIAVARVVAEIVDAGQTVRAYQVSVPLTTRLANLVADIGELESAKRQALECFDTQADTLATAGRIGRYLARHSLPASRTSMRHRSSKLAQGGRSA